MIKRSHIFWNLLGLGAPLVVAALTVPSLIKYIGNERFGFLALAWGLIGYAGALDIGVGRALTQMVGKLRGEKKESKAPVVLTTAASIALVTGLVGASFIILFAAFGGAQWISASEVPEQEIRAAMMVVAFAVPAQAAIATYRGLNEAFLNFKEISLLRMMLGMVNFGGPYLVALFTDSLPWLISTLVISRVLALIIYRQLAYSCLSRTIESDIQNQRFSRAVAKSLFSFGGWVTVSGVISPILVQADRFIIAFILSASAVAVYVVPYEVVTKSLILVGAISSVMFPALSTMIRQQPKNWQPYFKVWLFRVAVIMGFVCVCLALILPILLELWLKQELDSKSILVGQILCVGVFANSIGSMYFSLIQAKGRADITAKLHLLELPIYIVVMFILLRFYGLAGAAWAWSLRMILDVLGLAFFSRCRYG